MIGYDPYDAEPWRKKCEELEAELAQAKRRHLNYLNAIGNAIGLDREKDSSGHFLRSDAYEIRRIKTERREALRRAENAEVQCRREAEERRIYAREIIQEWVDKNKAKSSPCPHETRTCRDYTLNAEEE